MEIIKSYKTTDWSGGKTTEMFVYPPTSSYADRNFDFRISSATVEVEESDFTDLSGYHRLLTILDGQLELSVNNEPAFVLKRDVPFWFLGSDKVKSRGVVRDFNVIYSSNYKVNWTILTSSENRNVSLQQGDFAFYYLLQGEVELNDKLIKENELVMLNSIKNAEIQIVVTSQNEFRMYEILIQLNR